MISHSALAHEPDTCVVEYWSVDHSILSGKVIDRKMPIPIPIYMDLRVAPVVGLVGGTDEDFHVVLADIEEHMTGAVTEVDVTEGTAPITK